MPEWTKEQYEKAKALQDSVKDPEVKDRLGKAISTWEAQNTTEPEKEPQGLVGRAMSGVVEGAESLQEGIVSGFQALPEIEEEERDWKGGIPEADKAAFSAKMAARMAEEQAKDHTLKNRSKLPELAADPEFRPVHPAVAGLHPAERMALRAPVEAPYRYNDPSPEFVASVMRASGDKELAREIEEQGEDSSAYQKYTDAQWVKVREAFEEQGAPVIRADIVGGGGTSAFGAGFLDSTTMGLASEGPQRAFSSDREFRALEKLERLGVIPDRETRMDDLAQKHTKSNVAGRFAGAVNPFGAAGQIGRMFGMGKGFVKSALGAAGGAGLERAGELGTESAVRAATDKPVRDPNEIVGEVGTSAVLGGLFGGALGTLGSVTRKGMDNLRGKKSSIRKPKQTVDLDRLEAAGGRTTLASRKGLNPGKEVDSLGVERVPGKVRYEPVDVAASDIARRVGTTGYNKVSGLKKTFAQQNEEFFTSAAGQQRVTPRKTVRAIIDTLKKRQGSIQLRDDPSLKKLQQVEIPSHFRDYGQDFFAAKQAAERDGAILVDAEDLRALGKLEEAMRFYKNKHPDAPVEDLFSMSRTEGGPVVALVPKRMNAREYQETLGSIEDVVSVEKLKGWKEIKRAMYQDRNAYGKHPSLGKSWAEVKADQYEALSEFEESARALGSRGDFSEAKPIREGGEPGEGRDNFMAKLAKSVSEYGSSIDKDRAIERLAKENPEIAADLERLLALKAFNRLTSGEGLEPVKLGFGSTGQQAGAVGSVFDFYLDAMRRHLNQLSEGAVGQPVQQGAAGVAVPRESQPLNEEHLRRMRGATP